MNQLNILRKRNNIRQLIEMGKDVFEYSVFGSPNQKIGKFAQSKLGDFNA